MSAMLGVARSADGLAELELLGDRGWDVAVVASPAGVRVTARRGPELLAREGASIADIALELLLLAAETERRAAA